MADQIKTLYPNPDAIAGVATGAIGMGLLVAEILSLPFVYIRPEAKSHGRQNKIEGQLGKTESIVCHQPKTHRSVQLTEALMNLV